jgi:hypothetical protein
MVVVRRGRRCPAFRPAGQSAGFFRSRPGADKGDEWVELLQLDKSGIRVASYLTELQPRQLLWRKLHETLAAARVRLKLRDGGDSSVPD